MNAKLRKLTSRLSIMLTVGVCACGSVSAALPTGAVRMGGIKSSGCYVNTRYAANSRTRVVMSFQLNALPQDTGSYAGIQEKNDRQFMFGVGKDLHFKIVVSPPKEIQQAVVIDIGQADTGLHEFDVASGSQKFDGKEYGTSTTDDGATDPLYIFGMNNCWIPGPGYLQSITVYSCKIYEGDTLVRDFIPCQYEGRARLWDDANGEWYDKEGSGTFEAIAGITVDEIPSVLSDGRQYLKTGVVPTPKTRLELDFQMMSTQGTQMIGFQGNPNEKGQFFFSVNKSGCFASSVVADQGTAEGVVTIDAADTKRHTLVMESGSQTLDGEEYAHQVIPEGVFTDEIWLFAANNQWDSQNKYYCSMRFFGCKIYEGNELIRDYRPVMTALGPAVVDFVSMRQGEPTTCTYDPDESLLTRAAAVVTYGKSHIDTGVRLTPQTAVRVDFKMDKPDARQSVIGYQGGGNGLPQMIFSIQDRTSKGQGFCFISSLITQADGRDYSVAGPADTNRHVIELRPGSQKFDGVEYATEALPLNAPAVTDDNLYLFAFNNRYGAADAVNRATMRIYRCQIWEGDTLVRDFRPMALPNGVGCLVDAVTGYATYFGKGDFNLGSEPRKQGLKILFY